MSNCLPYREDLDRTKSPNAISALCKPHQLFALSHESHTAMLATRISPMSTKKRRHFPTLRVHLQTGAYNNKKQRRVIYLLDFPYCPRRSCRPASAVKRRADTCLQKRKK